MIRSMTGWGEAERDTPAGRLRLEVKSVNHRFFNAKIKLPSGFDRFEREVQDALKVHLRRGHVSAHLSVHAGAAGNQAVPLVNLEKARAYRDALEAVRTELDLAGSVDVSVLARFGDVFRAAETPGEAPPVTAEDVRTLAEDAARAALVLREAEGRSLRVDLEERLDAIDASLDEVESSAPERLAAERERLRERILELSEQTEVDEDRLAREIAYLAEKWDLNEEIVRFRSHVGLFRDALDGDGSASVGKRLGFLAQEMLREANTIASKANHSGIGHATVTIKEEIERLREQVENVE